MACVPMPVTVTFHLLRLRQVHAAFGALARCIADHLGVHRASVCPRPARVLSVARICVIGGVWPVLPRHDLATVPTMSIGRCFARHQRHAAFGAVSGGVANDFGVHRASVFHAHLKSGGVKLPAVSAKRARGDHAAQIGQPGSQPGPCQRGRHVRIGQWGDVACAQCQDRAGARHLRVGDGGGIAQTVRNRADDDENVGMSRGAYNTQVRIGKVDPHRPRDRRAGQHKGRQIARHGRRDRPPDPVHRALSRADDGHCRLNAPWLQP